MTTETNTLSSLNRDFAIEKNTNATNNSVTGVFGSILDLKTAGENRLCQSSFDARGSPS